MQLSLSREHLLRVAIASLFALFVVMLPRYTDTAKTWYVLLILSGVFYLACNPEQVKQTSKLERYFFVVLVLNFLWILFSFYVNGEPGRGASFVWGRHFYLPFLIPLFFLFRQVKIPGPILIVSLLGSVCLSLGDILIDIVLGIDHRLQGMNPNAFGPVQIGITGMLLFCFFNATNKKFSLLALCGFIMGIATVIFSLSRSTLLTAAILAVGFGFYLSGALSIWKRIAVVTSVLVLIGCSYLLPAVKNRVDTGITSISAYLATDDYRDSSRKTSFGERVELWKTGWKIFLENPLTGAGVGGFRVLAKKNAERYQVNETVKNYKYVHNQYIAALATRGFPGLILMLSILLLPIYIALADKAVDRDARIAQLSIILICLTYLIGNLAEDHFEGKSSTMFCSVMLALYMARLSPQGKMTSPQASA